ncbi:MAG: TIGR04182 family glycosyltransferase [Candidatus Alkanophagales archaeon]|nr:MAG: TIGR04182 family glycosyltransferase [Candidatus Alkanophagales archaeon]
MERQKAGERQKVCILIPTLNEEQSIGDIVREFKSMGYDNILVIDGGSTDRTVEIARGEGAKVVIQEEKGKGAAIIQAFRIILEETDAAVIVMIDGDGTYSPSEVEQLLKPIFDGDADHVIGSRIAHKGAFRRLNWLGNKIINRIFGFGYGIRLRDILSGYRALTRECIEGIELKKPGFEVEAEMTIECVKKGFRIKEVPITYGVRRGRTKLSPLRDGFRIAYTIYILARTYNPIFYFGVLGTAFIIAGLLTGTYVVMEWLRGVTHVPLAVLTALLITSGIQFLVFGLLGDMMVALQREVMSVLRRR